MSDGFGLESETDIYQGHFIRVAVGTFRAPDGSTFTRDLVRHPGAVGVVPLLPNGDVVLVRQYRAPIDAHLLEIPAGVRDVEGEAPELTAERELIEEVGLRPGRLEFLTNYHNAVGFCDERIAVYLGTELEEVDTSFQGIEEQHMTIERIPLDDVTRLIEQGELTDAKTIIGLLLTLRRLGR